MGKAITKRDDAKAAQEAAGAAIAEAKALIQQLADEIADLGRQIAALNKALNEATKLRAEERAENEKTLADANAGKEAVEQAISTLKAFYETGSFVQIRMHQPKAAEGYEKTFAKGAGRDGKTVNDLAPEIFEHGDDDASKYDESKGIIGLLDVIQSDFEGTIEATTSEEEEAETNFGKFKTDTETDIEEKETTKKNKEDKKVETEDELLTQQGNLADETENLELAEKALAGLKSQCVDGAETYEERVAKREQEIESLKQAMEILDNWKTGFMQRN
jgi:chromosome segregation ATPase